MNKQVSYKTVSLTFGILVACFVIGFYVLAWTEPTTAPPGDNVPAPINVGDIGQSKLGALNIKGGFESEGATLLATVGGNVGIGTTGPSQKLDVDGQIHATGEICTDAGGGACLSSSGGRITPVGPQSCIGTPSCTATVNCPIGTHVLYAIYHVYNQNGCPPGSSDIGAVAVVIENGDCNIAISPGGNSPHFAFTKNSSCSSITAIAGPAGIPQACILAFCIAN